MTNSESEGSPTSDRHEPGHLSPEELTGVARTLGSDPVARVRHVMSCAQCSGSLEAVASLRTAHAHVAAEDGRAADLAEAVLRDLALEGDEARLAPGRVPRPARIWAGVLAAAGAAAVATVTAVRLLAAAGGLDTGPALPMLLALVVALYPVVEEVAASGGRDARGRFHWPGPPGRR